MIQSMKVELTSKDQDLDEAVVQGLIEVDDGKPDFFLEMVKVFLDTAPKNIEQIHDWLKAKNYSKVSKLAHQMKSSSGNIGAVKFSKLCANLEKCEAWDSGTNGESYSSELAQCFASFKVQVDSKIKLLLGGKVA